MDALSRARDRALDLLLLDQLPGVGPVTLLRLVESFGGARRALGAPFAAFTAIAGARAARARNDPALQRVVESALERARSQAVRVMTWGDEQYPPELLQLADPPPVLFLRGRDELLDRTPAVAIVGARRSTGRGRELAGRLGSALAGRGVTVVSGLALGVDGAAHAGTLRAGGTTIAVLGTGADVAYPRTHRRLFDRIAEDGLLVSEFLPGTGAAPHHFPRRNRILAALAGTIVVVEAGRRSGSLITVDHGLDLGHDVWAVPGPIDTSACEGSNRLLADGARPLVSIDAFVEAVAGRAPIDRLEGADPAVVSDHSDDVLRASVPADAPETFEQRVLAALAQDALPVDELCARFGRPANEILAVLTTLELHGDVVRLAGLRFRRAA